MTLEKLEQMASVGDMGQSMGVAGKKSDKGKERTGWCIHMGQWILESKIPETQFFQNLKVSEPHCLRHESIKTQRTLKTSRRN